MKKYILNGKVYYENELSSYAKKSNLSLGDYLKESGAKEHVDNNIYSLNGKEYSGNELADFAKKSDLPYQDYLSEAGAKKKATSTPSSKGLQDGGLPATTPTTSWKENALNPASVIKEEKPVDAKYLEEQFGTKAGRKIVINKPSDIITGQQREQKDVAQRAAELDAKKIATGEYEKKKEAQVESLKAQAKSAKPKIDYIDFAINDIVNYGGGKSLAPNLDPNAPSTDKVHQLNMFFGNDATNATSYFENRIKDINSQIKDLRTENMSLLNKREEYKKGDIGVGAQKPLTLGGKPIEQTTSKEIDDNYAKINELNKYLSNLNAANDKVASVYAATLYPDASLEVKGKMKRKFLGDKSLEEQDMYERLGIPLTEEQKFQNSQSGIEVEKERLEQQYKGSVKDDSYYNRLSDIHDSEKALINQFPEYKKDQVGLMVAQLASNDPKLKKLVRFGIGNVDKDMVDYLSSKYNIPKSDLAGLEYGDIPANSSVIGNLVKGVYGVGTGLVAGATRIAGSALGVDPDRLTHINKGISESGNKIFGYNPYQALENAPTIIDTNPNSRTYLKQIENKKAGKYNYNLASISNAVAEGVGGFVGFIGGLRAVSAAGKGLGMLAEGAAGEDAAMTSYMVISGYENNYRDADRVLGKDASEASKALFAMTKGYIDALAFKVLPKDKLFGKSAAQEAAEKELASSLAGIDIKNINRDLLESKVSKVVQGILKTAEETGHITGAMSIADASKAVVNAVLGKEGKTGEYLAEGVNAIKNTIVQTPLSMALPLGIMEGVKYRQHSNLFKENLYSSGLKPDEYRANIQQELAKGNINEADAKAKLEVVDAMSHIVQSVPDVNPRTNVKLTHSQQVEYAYNRLKEIAAKAKAEDVKDDEALSSLYKDEAKKYAEERKTILEQKALDLYEERKAKASKVKVTKIEEIPEIKDTIDNLNKEIESGGENAGKSQLDLELIKKDPIAFYEKLRDDYKSSTLDLPEAETKKTIDDYNAIIDKIKTIGVEQPTEKTGGAVVTTAAVPEGQENKTGIPTGTEATRPGGTEAPTAVLRMRELEKLPFDDDAKLKLEAAKAKGEERYFKQLKTEAGKLQEGNVILDRHKAEDILSNPNSTIEERVTAKAHLQNNAFGMNDAFISEISRTIIEELSTVPSGEGKASWNNKTRELKKIYDAEIKEKQQAELPKQTEVEKLRAEEQKELDSKIPNAEQYRVDGKVDRSKLTNEEDIKAFDEVYNRYDKLITPLLKEAEVPKQEKVAAPQEGDIATLPPQIKNGMERTMIFKDGEWKQQVGGQVTGVSKSVQEKAQMEFDKANIPEGKTTTVSVAPYYDTQVANIEDAGKLRQSQGYKSHIEMLKNVAKTMGLKILGIDNTIGGFENQEGNKITEISNRVKLNTDNLDVAERYAAIVGALAHQTQEATIAAKYVEHGSPNQTAIETQIKVSDLNEAIKSLKEAGINEFEINESDNTIKILDFGNGNDLDFNDKVIKFADNLDNKKINYETEHHAIESRYISPESRSELLAKAEIEAKQSQSGSDFHNLIKSASKKSEEFLKGKVPEIEKTKTQQLGEGLLTHLGVTPEGKEGESTGTEFQDSVKPQFKVDLNENLSADQADTVKQIFDESLDNQNTSTSETVNIDDTIDPSIPTQKITIDPTDKRPESGLMSKLRIPLNFIFGKSVGLGMSDTLTTGERTVDVMNPETGKIEKKTIREEGGIGYPFKSLMDLINGTLQKGKKAFGWASVGEGAGSAMINAAKKANKITGKELKQHYFDNLNLTEEQKQRINDAIPDNKEYGLVSIYKMGNDGILSNEAHTAEAFRQIETSLNDSEKKLFFKLAKERLASLKWEGKENYIDLINSASNFVELEKILHGKDSKLPLGSKASIIQNIFLSTEKTVSTETGNKLAELLKSKGISIESVSRAIEEPAMKGIDKGQPMILLAIDPDSKVVEDANRERHKNYPYGVEGFPVGVFNETTQMHHISPEMMDNFVKTATTIVDENAKRNGENVRVSIYQGADGKFYAQEGKGVTKFAIKNKKGIDLSGESKEELLSKLKKEGYKLSKTTLGERYTQKINGTTFNNLLQKAKTGFISIFSNPKLSAQEKLVKYLQKAFPGVSVEINSIEYKKLEDDFKAQKLFNKDGKSYGFVKDGRVYLNPEYLNNNTPIHEYAHIWNSFAKNYKPEIYSKGVELITGSKYHDFVLNDAQYQKIIKAEFGSDAIIKDKKTGKFIANENNENVKAIKDAIADEALAKAIGDKGELFVNEAQKRAFTDWLNKLYEAIKKVVGFESMTPEQFQNLNLNQFIDAATKDILSGKKVSEITSAELSQITKTSAKFSLESQDNKIAQYIEDKRKAGESDADIKAGIESVADKLGLTPDKIDSLMKGEVKPEVKAEVPTEEPKKVGLSKAEIKKQVEEFDMLPASRREKITDVELDQMADDAIAGGYNVEDLVDKLRDSDRQLPNDLEVTILNKYAAALNAEQSKNPSRETLKKYTEALDAARKGLSLAGATLRQARRSQVVEDNLSNFLVDKQTSQGASLSDKQIKEETDKYNELKQAKDELEAELKIQREKYDQLIAEHGLNQAAAIAKKAAKKSSAEYKSERKASVEAAREALKKLRTGQSGLNSISFGVNELIAIAPHVKDFVRSLLSEGVNKLDDVITKAHAEFKDVLVGLSPKDVRDIIAGKHDEVKETRNELAAKMRLLERESKLLNELDSARKGEETAKTEKERVAKSRRIQELESQIKQARELNKEDVEPIEKTNSERLATRQKQLLNKISKLTTDLKEGNFAPEKKELPPLQLDRKTILMMDKVAQLETKIENERKKDEYEKKAKWVKGYDKVMQVLGLRRIVQSAIDLSVSFRQGATLLSPRQIDVWLKSFKNELTSVFSPTNYNKLMYEIRHSEDYHNMVADGITFNELESVNAEQRNEDFQNSFIYKVPVLKEPLLASQRAADGFLNTARYELYMKFKRNLERDGVTRQSDPQAYKDIAKWAMNMTGRGNLIKALEHSNAQKVLGNTFYGARLMASRFNMLNPNTYRKLSKPARVEALKDIAAWATTTLAVGAALAATTGAKVSLDPEDSEFMQLQYGNKKYDITGGMSIYVRTFLRLTNAIFDRATKSKSEADKASAFAGKSTLSFFRNKLAPNTGYAADAIFGKSGGQEFDPYDAVKIYPMYVDDFVDALKQDGAISLATVLLPNLVGIGYQSYEKTPEGKKKKEGKEGKKRKK